MTLLVIVTRITWDPVRRFARFPELASQMGLPRLSIPIPIAAKLAAGAPLLL